MSVPKSYTTPNAYLLSVWMLTVLLYASMSCCSCWKIWKWTWKLSIMCIYCCKSIWFLFCWVLMHSQRNFSYCSNTIIHSNVRHFQAKPSDNKAILLWKWGTKCVLFSSCNSSETHRQVYCHRIKLSWKVSDRPLSSTVFLQQNGSLASLIFVRSLYEWFRVRVRPS